MNNHKDRVQALLHYIRTNKQQFFQALADGKTVDDFMEEHKDEFLKIVFPEKFLVTIEFSAPTGATLSEAINQIEESSPLFKVVHCEKMETTK